MAVVASSMLSLSPAALLARGVAAPFTSPALTGARVGRDGAGRLTVSPSVDKNAERLTLHDRLLLAELARLPALTPRCVAAAAIRVARTGAAGRAARRAATTAQQRNEEDRLIAQFLLAIRLLDETGVDGGDWRHLGPSDPAFHDWLLDCARRLAPALGDDAAAIAGWLEQVSAAIAPVGLSGGEYAPRLRRIMDDVADLRDGVTAFAAAETGAAAARQVADRAGQALRDAAALRDACHDDLAALQRLYREWTALGPAMLARCEQLDWLLDGWPAACLLWSEGQAAGRGAQNAALAEICRLMQAEPAPSDLSRDPAINLSDDPGINLCDDPAIIDRIYRNELLKASAA